MVSGLFCDVQLIVSSSTAMELRACLATRSSSANRGVSQSCTMPSLIRLDGVMRMERTPAKRSRFEFVLSIVTRHSGKGSAVERARKT